MLSERLSELSLLGKEIENLSDSVLKTLESMPELESSLKGAAVLSLQEKKVRLEQILNLLGE